MNWIKEVLPKNGENPDGGRPGVDYTLTLEAAKLIAMSSKGEPGKLREEL